MKLGYESVVLVQPWLLLGDREALGQPTRASEAWARTFIAGHAHTMCAGAPSKILCIWITQFARALLR